MNINISGWGFSMANRVIIWNQSERLPLVGTRLNQRSRRSSPVFHLDEWIWNLQSTISRLHEVWNDYKVSGSFPDGQVWVLLISGSPPGCIPNVHCVPRVPMYRSPWILCAHVPFFMYLMFLMYQAAPAVHPGYPLGTSPERRLSDQSTRA